MAGFMRTFSTLLVLLMVVFSTGIMGGRQVAEAHRTCESHSQRYKGLCFRKANCAAICQTEGFHSGHCRGFRRRCFCTKHC